MKSLTVPILIALSAGVAFPQAGHWEAAVPRLDHSFVFALDLDKNAKGEWIASFGVPVQKISGLAVSELTVDGPNVKFKVVEFHNSPSFDLKLSGEAKLTGTMSSPNLETTLEFAKKGNAKVELAVPAPAVSKELEGEWAGAVEIPQGNFHIIVHFQNQPDKTVLATMDSPEQDKKDLKLSGVAQKGLAVEFRSKMTGGAYRGTLNKAGTEITGRWTQGGKSNPLKLKKK